MKKKPLTDLPGDNPMTLIIILGLFALPLLLGFLFALTYKVPT